MERGYVRGLFFDVRVLEEIDFVVLIMFFVWMDFGVCEDMIIFCIFYFCNF